MNNKVCDEWIKINIELHNKLEEMKKLDKERENLIKEAEEKGFGKNIKEKMNKSVIRYENLLEEIKSLNIKAKQLNDKFNS